MSILSAVLIWNLFAVASFAILYKKNIELEGGALAPVVYLVLGPIGTVVAAVKAIRK